MLWFRLRPKNPETMSCRWPPPAVNLSVNRLVRSIISSKTQNSLQMFVQKAVPRTSNLMSPIMLLSGHQSEVNCVKFHPNGNTLCSGGFDRDICMYCLSSDLSFDLWLSYDFIEVYIYLNYLLIISFVEHLRRVR